MKIENLLRSMRQQTEITLPIIGGGIPFTGIPYDLSFDKGKKWIVILAGKNNVHKRCIFTEI